MRKLVWHALGKIEYSEYIKLVNECECVFIILFPSNYPAFRSSQSSSQKLFFLFKSFFFMSKHIEEKKTLGLKALDKDN